MSVTVNELRNVPALRGATVLAGHGGLSRIISGISVLETADPTLVVEEYFTEDLYLGGDLVITSFINCLHDIPLQCANVQNLANLGAAGLILFYVGVHLPSVSPEILKICDEKNFVLLQMPVGHWELRYSEVISDVMAMILQDRAQLDGLVVEFLERVSQLPPHHRTVHSMLQLVSHRLGSTLALFDQSGLLLNLAPFPLSKAKLLQHHLQQCPTPDTPIPLELQDWYTDEVAVNTTGKQLHLLVMKEGTPLPHGVMQQLEELTRLCFRLWGSHEDRIAVEELIAAILQDDPIKMRRLAQIFHIDVTSMEELWIIDGPSHSQLTSLCPKVQTQFQLQTGGSVVGMYKERLLLVTAKPTSLEEAQTLTQELMTLMEQEAPGATLCRCCQLTSTKAVEQAFVLHEQTIQPIVTLYPNRHFFWKEDLSFVAHCLEEIATGEQAIALATVPLACLNGQPELLQTLAVYLLDANGSVARTGELQYLHKNTIKYRLGQITQYLGYPLDGFTQRMALFKAVAILRLLEHSN